MKSNKVISLFAGCGGLDLGFKKAGFRTIVATDNWGKACETLFENKIAGEVIHDDIRNLSFKKYKNKIDVVIGGPPCPPYSQTRHYLTEKKKGLEDEGAGFAVPEYFRVIKEVNPKVFLFENVDGFMFKTHQEALNFLIEKSCKLGYNITYKVINTANYGVPQTRKRFICVGVKKSLGDFLFPEETHNEKGTNNKIPWITCKDVLADHDFILPEEKKQKPGSKDYELLKKIPPGDNYLFFTEKRGCENPLFKWKSRYWTFLLKLSPDRPSWTIQASFSNNQGPFHWRNRFLRIEEIKRIQTINDSYKIIGDFKDQWRQVGNAVPSKLAEIFATEIKQQILKTN
jgi:DNA (cytosine-5)-methyltransferase 1